MKTYWIAFALLLSLALGSCGPSEPPLSTPLPVSPTQGDSTQMAPSQTPPASDLQSLIENARADLAQRLSIPVTQINLVEAVSVTWPDGSLGCPQPDMLYTQVQVDGLRIRFSVGDHIYEYHSGGRRAPFLCE